MESDPDRACGEADIVIEVIVDNRLRMQLYGSVYTLLPKYVADELREDFKYSNPAYHKLVAMGRYPGKEPRHHETWTCDDTEFTLPRGGLQRLREKFDKHNLGYTIVDNRTRGNPGVTGSFIDPWQIGMDLFPKHKLVAWEHQNEMVEAAKKYGQILMRAPTGSGKTSALLKLIAELQVPALVIMWETGLLKQWQDRIEAELGIPVKEQGIIKGSKFKLAPITLAMQQTFNRWDETKWTRLDGVFGFVACDEVQRYAAKTFTGIVDRFDSFYRVGVSADERRKDGKTYLIYDMFGKPRCEIKKQRLIDKRIIHDVECYVMPTQFTADWYVQRREAKALADVDYTNLLKAMQADEARNELAVHLLYECVQAGLPALSFTHRVEHAQMIAHALTLKGVATGLALGGPEWSETYNETIQQLKDGKLQVGCGTFGKLGVGLDIPSIAAGVAVTPVHNNKGFLTQVKGRFSRTTAGKQNARIILMWDRHVFGEPPLVNLQRWNEVCRVWCEWDKQWKEIDQYMKENRYGKDNTSTSTTTENLFQSAQAQAPTRGGRRAGSQLSRRE